MTVDSEERLVELYVYDLSRGLARQLSLGFLGVQIDAVYHTSVVVGGREYYYGQGIQYSVPGQTHHGAPMEVVPLGHTSLPDATIWEYLDSIKDIYSPERYDLFFHNCNNFSDTLAQFLCGASIPAHITSLPQTVLNTPFGQMLKPQLDQALRGVTQASGPPGSSGSFQRDGAPGQQQASAQTGGQVRHAGSLAELDALLAEARDKCAVIFFTSATCAPCRLAYPAYDELAAEAGDRAVLVKVDIAQARDVAMRYQISATPTFMTFLRGEKADEWKGANPAQLKANVHMLLRMRYPPHPHTNVRLPVTLGTDLNYITFTKIPPLDKVMAKLGDAVGTAPAVLELRKFLEVRAAEGAIEAPLPDLAGVATFLQAQLQQADAGTLFPLIDLFRAAVADARVAGWFAEEPGHATMHALLTLATTHAALPYALRLVTLQALCNLFAASRLAAAQLAAPPLAAPLVALVAASLLDAAHAPARAAASSLAFNTAVYVQRARATEHREPLPDDVLAELAAAVLEAVRAEAESRDVVRGCVLSLALLVYCAPGDGDGADSDGGADGGGVRELCKVLGAADVVRAKASKGGLGEKALCEEVARLLEV